MFDEFWKLYPRRVAKKAAEKAWSRVATSEALIEQIMAGLRAQLPELLKTYKRDRSMVPYPATWLNGHRWMDEIYALVNAMPAKMRNIKCEHCGDTGVVHVTYRSMEGAFDELRRCICPAGQLPGVLAGVAESA